MDQASLKCTAICLPLPGHTCTSIHHAWPREISLSTFLNSQRVCTGEPREPSELRCSCLAHLLDLSLQLPCSNSTHATHIALLAGCLRTAFPCLSWYWRQSQQAPPTPSLFRCEVRVHPLHQKGGFFLVQETVRITHPLESPPTVRKEYLELIGDPQPPLCKRDVHLLQEHGSPGGTHPACPHVSGRCQPALRICMLGLPLVTGHRFPLSPAWSYGLSELHQSTASKVMGTIGK